MLRKSHFCLTQGVPTCFSPPPCVPHPVALPHGFQVSSVIFSIHSLNCPSLFVFARPLHRFMRISVPQQRSCYTKFKEKGRSLVMFASYQMLKWMSIVSLTSFANFQFANILRRLANVFSRFANVVKLIKCIELNIYQICLKIFSLTVDKRKKNNLYMHWVSGFHNYLINTQHKNFYYYSVKIFSRFWVV